MYKKSLAIITACIFLFGCKKSGPIENPEKPSVTNGVVVSNVLQAKVGDFIYDSSGRKYKKRTDVVKGDRWDRADIWERVDPLVTNKWYTPSLGSTIFTNDPPSFNTLFRMDDENEPFFTK